MPASTEAASGSSREAERATSGKRQKDAQSRQRKPGRDTVRVRELSRDDDDDAVDARAEVRSDRRIGSRFVPQDEPRVIIRRDEPRRDGPRYESRGSFFPFSIFGGGDSW